MSRRLKDILSSQNIKAKAVRSSGLTFLSIGGSNTLRLISSLILTRLLFPEAFGLMALVQVFMAGLGMFSDTGIRTAIIRHARGDDPGFLNTAWTIQIIRGVGLWLGACAVAYPAALLYDSPLLVQILPVAGLNALISGFAPTKALQANRHLILGRITIIDMLTQAIGIVCMVGLAFMLRSVWALVLGGLVATVARVAFQHWFVPGMRNTLQWDHNAAGELFQFGKFIFLSTAVTFFIQQGDKAILGGFVSLAELGVYNIAYFLGAVPFMLCTAFNGKVIQPLYRMKPIQENETNRANVFKARRLVIGVSMLLCVALAFAGITLVDWMYDDRFSLAGPIVVLTSLSFVPRLAFMSYNGVLLAIGDTRRFFLLNLLTGCLQLVFMLAGVIWFGTFGVVVAPALASLATHPLRILWVSRYKGWDKWADLGFLLGGFSLTGVACSLYWDQIEVLAR